MGRKEPLRPRRQSQLLSHGQTLCMFPMLQECIHRDIPEKTNSCFRNAFSQKIRQVTLIPILAAQSAAAAVELTSPKTITISDLSCFKTGSNRIMICPVCSP